MNQCWKEIWNGKGKDYKVPGHGADEFSVYRELKRLDGYDVSVGDPEEYYRSFYDSAVKMWEQVIKDYGVCSAYEAGCGSGANLYLLQKRGIQTGGIDYSEGLVSIARKVLGDSTEITAGEAVDIETESRYDMVFSDGVFAYFPDEEYGRRVLEKMFEKARKAVIILEVFDKELQEECEEYRCRMLDGYQKKYEGLDKVFYSREMFTEFAQEHGCRIEFGRMENEYYWNSRYLFHCFLYK